MGAGKGGLSAVTDSADPGGGGARRGPRKASAERRLGLPRARVTRESQWRYATTGAGEAGGGVKSVTRRVLSVKRAARPSSQLCAKKPQSHENGND